MGNPTVPLDLTLSGIEGQVQGYADFESLYPVNQLSQVIGKH